MVTREEFEELKRLVLALISREDKRAMYDQADKGGIRQTESNHGEAITINADDVSDLRNATEELYEMMQGEE